MSKLNQYLAAVGIPSDIATADAGSVVFAGWADTTPDTQCSIYRGTYDIADYAYVLGGDIYSNYYYTYSSTQIPSDDNPNGSPTHPDQQPGHGRGADRPGLRRRSGQAERGWPPSSSRLLLRQNNEIPLYYRAETTGVANHVGGWTKYNPSSAGPTWNAENWWFIP